MGHSTNKDTVFVGIDPGASGAICALNVINHEAIFQLTTTNPEHLMDWFAQLKAECDVRMIMIEDVHAIPGASAGSNFKFGYNVGIVNTIAEATGLMVDNVTSKKWQSGVGLTVSADIKGAARQKKIKGGVADICSRLYPKIPIRGPKGGLMDGRSDALMIAHFASLKYSQHLK